MARSNAAPSAATSGGGLFGADGQVGTIKRARAGTDAKGTDRKKAVVVLDIDDESGKPISYPVKLNYGDASKFKPSEDGLYFETEVVDEKGNGVGSHKDSQWSVFAASLNKIDPEWDARLGGTAGFSALDGLKALFLLETQKAEFKDKNKPGTKEQKEIQFLVVRKILSGAGAAKSASSSANGAADAIAVPIVVEVLQAAGGALLKRDLFLPVNKRVSADSEAKAHLKDILALVQSDAWLKSADRPWTMGQDMKLTLNG